MDNYTHTVHKTIWGKTLNHQFITEGLVCFKRNICCKCPHPQAFQGDNVYSILE